VPEIRCPGWIGFERPIMFYHFFTHCRKMTPQELPGR
jgi:hypothetical protein